MKVVYSQWSLGKCPFKEMIACSNRLSQAHGFETILYTDEKGKEDLKNIQFSEVRLFPEKINQLPKKVWSLGKLVAMSDMNEPFFHIDQDIFMYKNVLKDLMEKDFVCLHDEPTAEIYLNLFPIHNHFQDIQPNLLKEKYEMESKNFGIVGGKAFKELKQVTSEIVDICIENKNTFESFNHKPNDGHILSVFIEQIWIPAMMKKLNIFPSFVLDVDVSQKECFIQNINQKAKELGVAHFWTGAKDKHRDVIIKYAKKLGVTY